MKITALLLFLFSLAGAGLFPPIADSSVVYTHWKVGDNGDMKDGFLVDYYDPLEWGHDPDYSDNMRIVYSIIKLKRAAFKDSLKKWVNPCGDSGTASWRIRSIKVNYDSIAAFAKYPTYSEDVRNKDPTPIIDGTTITKKYFTSAATLNPAVMDGNTIASGICSVGTSMTYATWAAFAADIAATLTGDLTARQATATTETAQSAINKALAGYTLTLTSLVNPKGNFSGGYLSTYNVNTNGGTLFKTTCSSVGSGAVIVFSNLNLKYVGAAATGYVSLIQTFSNTTNILNNIYNCVLNGDGHNVIAFRIAGASCVVNMFNCVIANGLGTGTQSAMGIYLTAVHSSSIFENITIYKMVGAISTCGTGITNQADIAVSLKNIASLGNSTDYVVGSAVVSKCASSDNTGSEPALRSLNAATQFTSTTITDDAFLKLRTGGVLNNAGVAPGLAANTYGIRRNARPHGSGYSIGADEFSGGLSRLFDLPLRNPMQRVYERTYFRK